MSTLARALEIAHEAHAGQVDKAGRPYIEHVLRVVDAVKGDDAKIVAALHDVPEDRPAEWSIHSLKKEGFDIFIILDVFALTKRESHTYRRYIKGLTGLSERARAVKIADLRDNSDTARLALLPDKDRLRLTKKYADALKILGANPTSPTPEAAP